ncbi:hypothetical protein ACJJTC_000999 [Scirpophaga incertulas]
MISARSKQSTQLRSLIATRRTSFMLMARAASRSRRRSSAAEKPDWDDCGSVGVVLVGRWRHDSSLVGTGGLVRCLGSSGKLVVVFGGAGGHLFGLELVSAKTSRRLRCSVAVFLCWAFIVASALTVYLVHFAIFKQQIRLDIGLNATWYHRRAQWQALKAYEENFLNLPVQNVIIGHTAGQYCNEKYSCIKIVLDIQNDHLKRGFDDIGPNFLLGGNGLVFEGRGANVVGAMVKYWNLRSISVMFIGDYRTSSTDPFQFDHLNTLLETLVDKLVLRSDYVVFGHCQVSTHIISPGKHVMENLKRLSHWNATNSDKCLHYF